MVSKGIFSVRVFNIFLFENKNVKKKVRTSVSPARAEHTLHNHLKAELKTSHSDRGMGDNPSPLRAPRIDPQDTDIGKAKDKVLVGVCRTCE